MPHPRHPEEPAEAPGADLPVEPEMPQGEMPPELPEDVAGADAEHHRPAAPR